MMRTDRDEAPNPTRPWQMRSRGLLVGLASVVAVPSVCLLVGVPPVPALMAAAVVAGVIGVVQVRQAKERAERTEQIFADQARQLAAWQTRWQELHAEGEQTASVLSQMLDGVIVLAADRRILLINPAARRLLDFAADDSLLGRPFNEVVRFPDLSRAVTTTAAGEGAQEVMIEAGGGSPQCPIRVRVDRISGDSPSNLLLTFRDETEARRVEEMRREFVANVSHELKTPLAAIKGYAETVELAIEDDPAAASHFMSQIRTQCLRLERLVAEMMLLARAQAGRDKLHLVTVLLSDVIAESLKSYRPVATAKRIDLTVAAPRPEARVTADREATLTILNNLIGNAIRYTPTGGHVRVDVRESDRFWCLVVSDDGVGIAENEQERIFERFYRVERTRESARGGTGLGLSIVKNLTIAQGGEVRLKSRPGKGSTFEVLLPAAQVTGREAGQSA